MIDIHTHILWGVDDGPSTLEESLYMLRVAAEFGTTDIVATPHVNSEFQFDLVTLNGRYEELVRSHGGLPRIHRGYDFHLSVGNIQDALENPKKYTVNGGRYLMVELPEMFSPAAIDQVLLLLLAEGMVPIITHPERNAVLQRMPEALDNWLADGCLTQVTGQSMTGNFGRRAKEFSWRFLRSGKVHFVASDAHDGRIRPPRLDRVRALLVREIGEYSAARLTDEHPRAVIENDAPPPAIAAERKPRLWLFQRPKQ